MDWDAFQLGDWIDTHSVVECCFDPWSREACFLECLMRVSTIDQYICMAMVISTETGNITFKVILYECWKILFLRNFTIRVVLFVRFETIEIYHMAYFTYMHIGKFNLGLSSWKLSFWIQLWHTHNNLLEKISIFPAAKSDDMYYNLIDRGLIRDVEHFRCSLGWFLPATGTLERVVSKVLPLPPSFQSTLPGWFVFC